MVFENLKPRIVWDLFENLIAQTPRPSKHEEKVREVIKNYILNKKDLLKIQYSLSQDNVGNILIKKPASTNSQNLPPILLQAHLDMVCETDRSEGFDFMNQGIPLRIQDNNEWVDADGTTLGADNGIGLALALAILTDPSIESHGPIEVLFTVNEEDGFDGAALLDPKALNIESKLMINLDGGPLGEIVIGSVGGRRIRYSRKFEWNKANKSNDLAFYEICINGLLSGHSGEDIHLPRANANKIMSSILSKCFQEININISSWKGGTKGNVIPAKALAKVAVKFKHKSQFETLIKNEIKINHAYFDKFEKNLRIEFNPTVPSDYLSISDSRTLLATIHVIPHGMLKMSPIYSGFVESSNNLAIINTENSNDMIWLYPRSLIRSELDSFCLSMIQLGELGGWRVFLRPVLPEWLPDLDSKLLKYVKAQYESILGVPAKTNIVHGGLETGMISTRIPGLQMISLGPTMEALHSPSERMKIADIPILYELLIKIITNLHQMN